MQTLGLKIFTTCNSRSSRSWPCMKNSRAQPFRLRASLDSDGDEKEFQSSSFLSRSQTYALLKQQMAVAAKSEDYKEAARIRDSLKLFEEEEPVLRLRRLMKKAADEERFEDAAMYRNELLLVAPHSLLKCSSDETTMGIRVQVRSVYIEKRSQPSKEQYFFAYRIRITNNSDRPVQLLRRHWIITNANWKTENVWGVGVIGEQPVILPRTGFEYSSACPLSTPSGRMFFLPTFISLHALHQVHLTLLVCHIGLYRQILFSRPLEIYMVSEPFDPASKPTALPIARLSEKGAKPMDNETRLASSVGT